MTAEKRADVNMMEAIELIAGKLLEPVTLPSECPPLTDRILAAIDELVRERTEARTNAHDMATEVMRLSREIEELKSTQRMKIESGKDTVDVKVHRDPCQVCQYPIVLHIDSVLSEIGIHTGTCFCHNCYFKNGQ